MNVPLETAALVTSNLPAPEFGVHTQIGNLEVVAILEKDPVRRHQSVSS
jgi:hypothetical protein